MPPDVGKKLFHTIVVAGAALGGCGGKADDTKVHTSESVQDAQRNPDDAAPEADGGAPEPLDSDVDSPIDVRDQDVHFPHITR